mgnify:CR=1 FL=1
MNCINCGALLTDEDYCGHCGFHVLVQKKAYYLSDVYYNLGLEKAGIRDLSGAADYLQMSLAFNKNNIQSRNLLGLIYFETGETAAALSEWIISKNLRPVNNLASEYIDKLQANLNKLEALNESVRKYNQALAMCQEGHEDVAAIQLKKILSQNPKLVKGYQLLALIQIKHQSYGRARKTLRKAIRIDRENTTTLRFLHEVDEQTGVVTRLEPRNRRGRQEETGDEENKSVTYRSGNDVVIQPLAYRESTMMGTLIHMGVGFLVGIAALWFLAVPAIRQGIYREANEQIVDYSDSLASQSAQLTRIQNELAQSDSHAEETQAQIAQAQRSSESYAALLAAYQAYRDEDLDTAAVEIQKVYVSTLSDSARDIYTAISNETGVTGITEEEENVEDRKETGDTGEDTSASGEGENDSGYEDYGDYDASYQDDGSDWDGSEEY